MRRRLPNRRGHELLDFEHAGISYTAGVGRFEDGSLAEIFLNTGKHGTAVDVNARDAAVAASLLLQHGCPIRNLCAAPLHAKQCRRLGLGTAGTRPRLAGHPMKCRCSMTEAAKGGRPTDAQLQAIEDIRAASGRVQICRVASIMRSQCSTARDTKVE